MCDISRFVLTDLRYYSIAYLSFYHEKVIKDPQWARVGIAGHLSITLNMRKSRQVPFQTAQEVNLRACSPHCPFNAQDQAEKLWMRNSHWFDPTWNQTPSTIQLQTHALSPVSHLSCSVANESLQVESESSLDSMMLSPVRVFSCNDTIQVESESFRATIRVKSSPSLFVQRLESSQVNLHHRLESSRVSLHTDSSRVSTSLESTRSIKLLKILTCGNFHAQFYCEAIARRRPILYINIKYARNL